MKEARSYRTKQREMVLQFFSAHPGKCFCAKELIAQKSIPVGSATLYRTLALLCQEGKLKKYTDVSSNSAFYQYNESDSCHYHFHLKPVNPYGLQLYEGHAGTYQNKPRFSGRQWEKRSVRFLPEMPLTGRAFQSPFCLIND